VSIVYTIWNSCQFDADFRANAPKKYVHKTHMHKHTRIHTHMCACTHLYVCTEQRLTGSGGMYQGSRDRNLWHWRASLVMHHSHKTAGITSQDICHTFRIPWLQLWVDLLVYTSWKTSVPIVVMPPKHSYLESIKVKEAACDPRSYQDIETDCSHPAHPQSRA
jgi:hypothetical protein